MANGAAMRYSLREGAVFGVIIGVAVLLIRVFVGGPLTRQLSALAIIAVVLAVAQFMVSVRRARKKSDKPAIQPPQPRPVQPQNPFARETNQAWTGLSSATVQELEQAERAAAAAADSTPLSEKNSPDAAAGHPPADDGRSSS